MRVTWHDKPPRRAPPPEKPPPKAEPADAVIAYHEATKHTYWSVREGNFQLDWANQPLVYKRFEGVPWVQLPSAFPKVMPPTLTALEALADRTAEPPPVDLAAVGQLCYYAYGLTAKKQYPGVTYYLRSAPSAGALFPVEATLVVQDIEGLPDGVYHYSVADFALFRMREGRFGPLLAAATAGAVRADAPVTLVLSTIFWRSSWKYRDRAYRYCLQDAGHAAGNFLTVGRGLGYRVRLCTIFADEAVNALIDVDDAWEGAMALVSLDPPSGEPEPPVPEALEAPERLDSGVRHPFPRGRGLSAHPRGPSRHVAPRCRGRSETSSRARRLADQPSDREAPNAVARARSPGHRGAGPGDDLFRPPLKPRFLPRAHSRREVRTHPPGGDARCGPRMRG